MAGLYKQLIKKFVRRHREKPRRINMIAAARRFISVLVAASLINMMVIPAVSEAEAPKATAASQARAEADAKVIVGTGMVSPTTPRQPAISSPPKPIGHHSVPSGNVTGSQASTIAAKSLNIALGSSTNSEITQNGDNLTIGTQEGIQLAAQKANAERDLRQQLALQGNTEANINAVVNTLKSMGTSTQSSDFALSVPQNSNNGIGFGPYVTLGLPTNSDAGNATPVGQNAVVYANTSTATDTVVKAVNASTLETYDIIRSNDAPEDFAYTLDNLPPGALLKQVDSQTIEAYIPQSTVVQNGQPKTLPEIVLATVKAPWAHDANGVTVPTSLTIGAANTIVMHVLHKNRNYLYPIVADPFAWWGWWGWMFWANDYTITHWSALIGAAGSIAGALGWGIAAAAAGVIIAVAQWCQGRNGATFYFVFTDNFAGCGGW